MLMGRKTVLLVENGQQPWLVTWLVTNRDADAASISGGGFKTGLVGPTGPRAGHQRPSPDKGLGMYTEAPSWGLPCHCGLVHVLTSGPEQLAVVAWRPF